MKILVVGNDARTHVVAETLANSPQQPVLFTYMKANHPGLAKLSEDFELGDYNDLEKIKTFAESNAIDFAIIGPEGPLSEGVVDALDSIGIKSVGPVKALAKLETSKAFTRLLGKKYNIPGMPLFQVFESKGGLKEFAAKVDAFVVKPDGLTGGKGVMVQGDHFNTKEEGLKIAQELIEKDGIIVLEEKLIGEEFSLMSLCDGKNLFDFPPVQDHKRAFVGDKGPNTGGMGSYTTGKLLPFMTVQDLKDAHNITLKMAEAIEKETGIKYKGVMYGGFICTKDGVKLIEYNARFGDPEAMNILPVLKNDFVEVCKAVIDGTLDKITPSFREESTVCKYAVPEGYPSDPVSGRKISLKDVPSEAKVYLASVEEKQGEIYMSRSRAVAFVGIASDLEDAEVIAENAVSSVKGPVAHREDIGTMELIQKRIDHMKELRG
ncbi:MAG: phosphoribosylamine--glycine ligase [Nanoarchaeota archaeon]|nr:phosphoribosylamine--glycine ligase [Nanoarchaeota archaeon]MBU1704862.1 phosphoribosylamine--glycine ligase [Nanoarchaeota archaeon]